MLTGMGSLSYGELAGERIKLGLMLHDPEEEHDCFSDNTHYSHYYDQVGIMNVYLGTYKRIDGSTVKGPSLSDLVAAEDKAVDADLIFLAIALSEQMQKAQGTWTSPEEHARFNAINEDLKRIYETGTPCQASVVSLVKTDEKVANIPVFHITLDVHDTDPPRRLLHVRVMGDNRFFLRRFKAGKQLQVHLDPNDPDRLAITG